MANQGTMCRQGKEKVSVVGIHIHVVYNGRTQNSRWQQKAAGGDMLVHVIGIRSQNR